MLRLYSGYGLCVVCRLVADRANIYIYVLNKISS